MKKLIIAIIVCPILGILFGLSASRLINEDLLDNEAYLPGNCIYYTEHFGNGFDEFIRDYYALGFEKKYHLYDGYDHAYQDLPEAERSSDKFYFLLRYGGRYYLSSTGDLAPVFKQGTMKKILGGLSLFLLGITVVLVVYLIVLVIRKVKNANNHEGI